MVSDHVLCMILTKPDPERRRHRQRDLRRDRRPYPASAVHPATDQGRARPDAAVTPGVLRSFPCTGMNGGCVLAKRVTQPPLIPAYAGIQLSSQNELRRERERFTSDLASGNQDHFCEKTGSPL